MQGGGPHAAVLSAAALAVPLLCVLPPDSSSAELLSGDDFYLKLLGVGEKG